MASAILTGFFSSLPQTSVQRLRNCLGAMALVAPLVVAGQAPLGRALMVLAVVACIGLVAGDPFSWLLGLVISMSAMVALLMLASLINGAYSVSAQVFLPLLLIGTALFGRHVKLRSSEFPSHVSGAITVSAIFSAIV